MADTNDDGHQSQLGALVRPDPGAWRTILQASNQVVLYNPTSHALSVDLPAKSHVPVRNCPYCKQVLPTEFDSRDGEVHDESWDWDPAHQARAANYFHLLELSNETSSRPASPPPDEVESTTSTPGSRNNGRTFPAEAMAEGYFKAFFQEEYKLGMGANGSVFLCQHVLDGTPLGHFAVKKIAVGESHSYLLKILREVRLLEQMRHPNIITYHHAWLETCQFSQFGPKIPTLHVLMQWAEGGSLDDFIDVRLGRPTKHIHVNPLSRFSTGPSLSSEPGTPTSITSPILSRPDEDDETINHSRSARIRAFRAFQRASPEEKARMRRRMEGENGIGSTLKAVHLLSAEEVESLFSDVVEGLAFLHEKSILHLDLKPGNVLLTWDEGKLIPRAMLSDFGTSRDRISTSRVRSGNTGTLEYSSPESLPSLETGLLRQVDSKSDMWSLGMILYKMLFFQLPYRYAAVGDANGQPISSTDESTKMGKLEKEVLSYAGFKSTPEMMTQFETRRLPRSFLILLESLLNIVPPNRPSVERISVAIKDGKFNPQEISHPRRRDSGAWSSFMPVVRRQSPPSARLGGQVMATSSETRGTGEVQTRIPVPAQAPLAFNEEERQHQVFASGERVKLLGPPESTSVDPIIEPSPEGWRLWWRKWLRVMWTRMLTRIRMLVARDVYVRMVKSLILVIKALTISRTCVRDSLPLAVGILSLALLDMVSDDLWLSGLLAILHVTWITIICRFSSGQGILHT